MLRELPKLNIVGTEFFVDVRLQEFRQADDPSNRISFEQLTDDGNGYLMLFDKEGKNLLTHCADGEKLPESAVWLRIPSLFVLDPVGMARLCGQPDGAYTSKYESCKSIVAEPVLTRNYGPQRPVSRIDRADDQIDKNNRRLS